MIAKKHITADKRLVLAVCDSILLGQKFKDDEKQLDLASDFYAGDETPADEVEILMKKAYILNLIGEESVKLGIAAGLVSTDNTGKVDGIPYAQVLSGAE